MAPRQVIEEEQPWRIRVTRPDGTTAEIDHPQLLNDSIVTVDEAIEVTGIAVADVASLEVRKFSIGRSIGFTVLFVSALFGMMLLGFPGTTSAL